MRMVVATSLDNCANIAAGVEESFGLDGSVIFVWNGFIRVSGNQQDRNSAFCEIFEIVYWIAFESAGAFYVPLF